MEKNITVKDFPLNSDQISALINFTETSAVHFNTASTALMNALISNPSEHPQIIAERLNLVQENNTDAISKWVEEVILNMPEKVKEYQSGKKGLIGLFAGQVKKLSKGKADMQTVYTLLEEILK